MPHGNPRKISKILFKVLDAPELQDDFYLNLVDWSSSTCSAWGWGPACTCGVPAPARWSFAERVHTCVFAEGGAGSSQARPGPV